ncbi:MAG: SpoIIE family protein phosphatase, partial [Ruminiclostridium sp.]|nr:SpoIIE family protein phosphatase [Ruminiclostridium sp.]
KYKNYEITLKKGDSIFVYTDGVAEANNAEGTLFGTQRTVDVLNKDPGALPKETLKNVRTAVDEFVDGAPQFDDLTMMCFRYFG